MRRVRALVLVVLAAAACSRGVQPDPALHMVAIPPGTFVMGANDGADDEQPAHPVTLTKPFWIGRYEVTQAQYEAVAGTNPSKFQGAGIADAPQRPVENLLWDDAIAYCRALTARERAAGRVPAGYEYRLPTEAEWEFCCRAGTTTPWHTGARLAAQQANFAGARADRARTFGQTAPVGSYPANAWGLHDMHGNVEEWCLDAYAPYAAGAVVDPFVANGDGRVRRGGSWIGSAGEWRCRSSMRGFVWPLSKNSSIGFRVVLGPARVP